ncbi:MAG: EAL domain-containing protein [Clostridia bacterium]|nr:EAL domain-containing protein [Clostridia bacterium]
MIEEIPINEIPANPGDARKRKILIVEDEFVNREILIAMLEPEYEVIPAVSGEDAETVLLLRPGEISLVLLDLNLPDRHGLDILRELKEDMRTSKIPVIVLTSDRDSEVECLNQGAIDFIPKPYPVPKVVQARVRRIIELSEDRDLIRDTERDHLTGLYTREYFYRYAAQYDAFNPDVPTDALVLDVNHFQMINERFGKQYADGVLIRIGQAIVSSVGKSGGIACRRSADTFLIYCPHISDYQSFLNGIVSAACGADKGRIRIRLGVCSEHDKSVEMQTRFDRAKIAADTIRGSFTDLIAFYDNVMHEKEVYAEHLLDEFQAAVDGKQFSVYFQPKYDIRPVKPVLCGAEALVRWIHPNLGFISPGVFIPLFEDNGMIRILDRYVWRETVMQIAEWKKKFGCIVPVSVNVSRVDMLDPDLVDTLCSLVRENGLEFSDLHLEITESAYTENAQQIISTVNRLRESGFIIEMDDFGAGYSSLNMLSTLPVDVLKLDMMFIRNIFSENGNPRMLKVIFEIADTLSVPMVAEGVDTAEQLAALREMGCQMVQGYYFSPPRPANEFENHIREWLHIAEPATV